VEIVAGTQVLRDKAKRRQQIDQPYQANKPEKLENGGQEIQNIRSCERGTTADFG
jgi:hypothetical protein